METLVASAIARLLENEPIAHVGVVDRGDTPYVTPVSFVWHDEALWFRTFPGRRLDALMANTKVSCEVSHFKVDSGVWESVIIQGTASVVNGEDTEERFMQLLRAKYRRITRLALQLPPDVLPEVGHIVRVQPDEISGRGSGRGVGGPERPGRI